MSANELVVVARFVGVAAPRYEPELRVGMDRDHDVAGALKCRHVVPHVGRLPLGEGARTAVRVRTRRRARSLTCARASSDEMRLS